MKLAPLLLALALAVPVALAEGEVFETSVSRSCQSACVADGAADPTTGEFRAHILVAGLDAGYTQVTLAKGFDIPQGATRIDAQVAIDWVAAATSAGALGPRAMVILALRVTSPSCGEPIPPECPYGRAGEVVLDTSTASAEALGTSDIQITLNAPEGGFPAPDGLITLTAIAFASTGFGGLTSTHVVGTPRVFDVRAS